MHDGQPGVRSRADRAALELVRLVMEDDWTPEAAAKRLRAHVGGDRAVLRLLRACVANVNLERSTPVSVRASLTLERTTTSGDPAVPRDTRRCQGQPTHPEEPSLPPDEHVWGASAWDSGRQSVSKKTFSS